MNQPLSQSQVDEEIKDLLKKLQAYGYQTIRPLVAHTEYNKSLSSKLVKAVILDTETTGTDYQQDQIIELGMVAFNYCPETGQIGRVYEAFDELEDPGRPIPVESTKIHHITDEMVSGKRIQDSRVEAFISDVSLIIAHNANFDRKFVESRFPIFSKKAWACTFQQIPWADEGLSSAKLEFLAYKSGFHYEGHRADIDCYALLEVLHSAILESGTNPLQLLLQNADKKAFNVSALNSPFDSKDKLKARRYRWNAEKKLWIGTVLQADLEAEKEWLSLNVYNNRPFSLEIEQIDAFNRFSNRTGLVETIQCSISIA